MPPAIIAGGIAAAGTIGGALLSSHSQSKAASQANDAQQAATQAQLQLGQESLGLNKDIYNSNYDLLSPFVSRGNVAGGAINALLGLPAAPTMHSPLAAPATPATTGAGATGGTPASSGYGGPSLGQIGSQGQMDAYMGYYGAHPELDPGFTSIAQFHGDPYKDEASAQSVLSAHQAYMASHPTAPAAPVPPGPQAPGSPPPPPGSTVPLASRGARPQLGSFNGDTAAYHTAVDAWRHPSPTTPGAPAAAGGAAPAANALSPQSAMENFANSAGMQFQLKNGADMINNQYAARGALQSGAAMKAIQNYGQQTALNNYFLPYMGLLGGQQAVGAQAGSAVAGVGSSFGNTAANINGQMGNAIGNGADSASNAALLRGQANSNMWNGIGAGLGGLASSFAGGGMPSYASVNNGYTMPVNMGGSAPYGSMAGGLY